MEKLHSIAEIPEGPLLLFDGVCNFCDSTVQFVIKRDKNEKIKFASLQSETGQKVLEYFQLPTQDFTTLVFIEDGKFSTKSTAAIKLATYLSFPWPMSKVFRIVPKVVRDSIYTTIARNRYKWFGKKDSCMIPSAEQRSRFLA